MKNKVALVYDLNDNKLRDDTYSWTYRGMWEALQDEADEITHINFDCDAKDIVADKIIFYDIHSSHNVTIKGIEKHPALKFEYMDDPFQIDQHGIRMRSNLKYFKLGAKSRMIRAQKRGLDFIICPYLSEYNRYMSQYAENIKLIWFPVAPNLKYFGDRFKPFKDRKSEILANGSVNTLQKYETFYNFRREVFKSPLVNLYQTTANKQKRNEQMFEMEGKNYPVFLSNWKAACALCEFPVPKYFEIPLAGCLTFIQYNFDAYLLGFRHKKNCIVIEPNNYQAWFKSFLAAPETFEPVAKAGQKLVENNYTAEKFAKAILGISIERK